MGALLCEKKCALVCLLLQDETSRESAVTPPAIAAATTVFLEQFTAAMGALREKNRALVQLLKMETSKESAVEQPSTATATTVFLEQFTAAMGALREKNCALVLVESGKKVESLPHTASKCRRHNSLPRTVHSRYGCPAREKL